MAGVGSEMLGDFALTMLVRNSRKGHPYGKAVRIHAENFPNLDVNDTTTLHDVMSVH